MIEANAFGDLLDVCAGDLADIRDLVDEADSRRQERVGRQLDHLRGGDVRPDYGRVQPTVESGDPVAVGFGERSDYDAIGMEKVLDSATFGQELRVRDIADVAESAGLERGPDLLAGADRDGALHDQDRAALELR